MNVKAFCQTPDSTYKPTQAYDTLAVDTVQPDPKPGRPALRSAILPGWGQVSNKQIWKLPIIYGAGGYTVFTTLQANRLFLRYREAYKIRTDGDPRTIDRYDPDYGWDTDARITSPDALINLRERYRRQRDLHILLTAGLYAIQILDAYVFGHLAGFDISDDLSMRVEPAFHIGLPSAGMQATNGAGAALMGTNQPWMGFNFIISRK